MAEAQPTTSRNAEVETDKPTQTVTLDKVETDEQGPPVLHLRLQPPKNDTKVKWSTDTVDNEFMGKKKSKCCCIYQKPKVFGETDSSSPSDSEDDSCTSHCRGHKKKCYQHKSQHNPHHVHDGSCDIRKKQ